MHLYLSRYPGNLTCVSWKPRQMKCMKGLMALPHISFREVFQSSSTQDPQILLYNHTHFNNKRMK